jgi:hypothetical protein
MPTLDSDPEEDNYKDITLAGNVTENPFVVVKNNKRTHAGQQPIRSLTYNNPTATVYIEPHTGIICSSCNLQDRIYIDADGHFRGCLDRKAHVILSNGFIYENKIGVGVGVSFHYPKPFILTGQDYRNVRDMCGISADLILRQPLDWTPSERMVEKESGQSFKSYRWHYNYMTKITGLGPNQWGLPSQLYGYRHKAIIRSNSAQTNITEEITTAEASIATNADALKAAKDEHKTDVDNLKLDVDNLQLDVDNLNLKVDDLKVQLKSAREIAVKATRADEGTMALLSTANERLRANNLEEVTAKAPVSDAESPTGGTGGAGGGSATTSPARAPESTPHPVSQSQSPEG